MNEIVLKTMLFVTIFFFFHILINDSYFEREEKSAERDLFFETIWIPIVL